MNNRLQFRHHNEVFATREAAIEYIQSQIRFAEEGLAADDKRLGYSLLAEPTVLLYENTEDATNPHVIITVGSVTNEGTQYSENKFCIIDIDKTEQEIADLEEALIDAIKSLTLITKDSDTLKLYAEKTEEGTYVSGDVKVAESHIFDDVRLYNNLMVTPEGLFLYVNLTYDENTEIFTFTVNNADGTLSETSVKLPNNYVTRGYYSVQDQSIHLVMRESEEVVIDCKYLIAEWDVEGDEAKSPVILTREEVDFDVDDNSRLKPWQDVLRADVRIKDESFDPVTGKPVYDPDTMNILRRTQDKKYLYVDGKASNIAYYMDGQRVTVKDALDKLGKIKLSGDYSNILQEKTDGFFASAKLNYISKENTLVFKVSNQEETRIKLNSFRLFENVYYDSTKEALIITYIDGNDELQIVEIPIGQMLTEWVVYNEGHTVELAKSRSVEGKDVLTADVKIFQGHNNILTETNHTMYVRGEADNIKYLPTGTTTVKDVLDELKAEDRAINTRIDEEIARAEGEEERIEGKLDQEIADRTSEVARLDATLGDGFSTDTHETVTYKLNEEIQNRIADVDEEEARAKDEEARIDTTIGTGFSTDAHETVTYKFNELTDRLATEETRAKDEEERIEGKLDDEIARATGEEQRIEGKLDDEITRSTEKDAEHDRRIDEVSANTTVSLKAVASEDNSIIVKTTEAAGPEKGKDIDLSVNLSSEIEDEKPNIIKLNADGLYAGVDLSYEKTANKLIFKTTNGTKEIQLESMSSIISIEYNPNKEAIVITYMTNGHEIKTVEIPVGDLIREWKPSENTDGAIKLTLTEAPSGTTGKDILYGEVLISDHSDNILVNDGGRLYVSNADITANTAAIEALEGRMDTAEGNIDALKEGLREETSARTLADEALGERINQEIEDRIADVNAEETRAISAETALFNKINADILEEKNRAEDAELALSNKIDADVLAEKNRATSAETALQEAINDEVINRSNAILAEETRAISAETYLQEALNREIANREDAVLAEETRAEAAEAALTNKINTDVEAERTRATSAEDALRNKIDTDVFAEETRAKAAETDLQNAINSEVTRATNEETRIEHLLNDEVSRSTAKDSEHDTKIAKNAEDIADEIVRAKAKEDVISGNVISEETRAKAVEEAIKSTLSAETADRISGDTMLSHLIADEAERRISGDTLLQNNLNTEIARARETEDRLDTRLETEIARANTAEGLLNAAITSETLRAQAADNELYRNIADVSASSIAADAQLSNAIAQETSRATVAENSIREALGTEINNRLNAETNLSNAITAETQARDAADNALSQRIDDTTVTFDDTSSIDFTITPAATGSVVTADVKLEAGENIIKCGSGLYATVALDYDGARNTIRLITSNGEQQAIQLNTVGSLIDGIEYDAVNRALVVRYHDAAGVTHQTSFPVNQLFNDWIVQNPATNSAIELTKTAPAEPDDADILSGRILITDDRDGDGKPDDGSDNLIEIRNNGLYVCGSAMTEAYDIAKCAQNELNVFEKVVIGHQINEECGSGYTYEPNPQGVFISSAISFANADFILDQNLNRVEGKVDDAVEEIDCIDSKTDALYAMLYTNASPMPDCGSGATYQPYQGACIISGATSFMEADQMLNDQICEILTMWVSGLTCTNESQWVEDGANRKIQIHSRLSRGRYAEQTDDDVYITDMTGDYIDPTNNEFTDTNALRIVCLEEGPSGTTPSVDTMQNGMYLSSTWDCGLYYGPSDTEAKASAAAAGYKTDYNTDEASTATDYDYNNNVRQNDIPHPEHN